MTLLSVIICTHNPREDYLRRTLDALRVQTLPINQWELLLIDNASTKPLVGHLNLNWHPSGRHIREEKLGLTAARLRGIVEAKGDILIFVDDDNVLDPDYLEQALAVGHRWPFIGAWGGGISPEFESPPPAWCLDQPWRLTIDHVTEEVWSNLREGFSTIPCGAGMCVRKQVAVHYVEWCGAKEISNILDRKGNLITGYGDMNLAICSVDLGLGTGKTPALHLTHLIPSARLTLDYLLRHAEGDASSLMVFRALRGLTIEKPDTSFSALFKLKVRRWFSRQSPELLKIDDAYRRGLVKGWDFVQKYRQELLP